MKYKLIALDLDGTLKNSKNKITPKTKKSINTSTRIRHENCAGIRSTNTRIAS